SEKQAEDILTEIRERIAIQSSFRLGVANLANLAESNHKYFPAIKRVTGYDVIEWDGMYPVLFDIEPGMTIQESLAGISANWNKQISKNTGIILRPKVIQAIPAFSISLAGAFYHQAKAGDKNTDELFRDILREIDIKLAEVKKIGPKIVEDPDREIIPQPVTEKEKAVKEEPLEQAPDFLRELFTYGAAMIAFKGGDFGGLDIELYNILLDKLEEDFNLAIGRRKPVSLDEALRIWGHTGIKSRLEMLLEDVRDEALKENVREAIRLAEEENGDGFADWLDKKADEALKVSGHFRVLVFLWDYLTKGDVQLILLKRKANIADILSKYGLAQDSIFNNEQDLVNAIVGEPVNPKPNTLRALAKEQLKAGSLQSVVTQAQGQGVPDRAIYATANAVHCPSFNELGGREWSIWKTEIKVLLEELEYPYQTLAPPAQQQETRSLNDAYRPILGLKYRNPTEIIFALEAQFVALVDMNLSLHQKYLLVKRFEYLINSLKEAYQANGEYTFYHALTAISNFLVEVAKQIPQDALNLYIARDGANFWLAGYMLAANKDAFETNNIIFHLSRERMGVTHDAMGNILDKVKAENPKDSEEFWAVLLRHFNARIAEDSEFSAKVEETYGRLVNLIQGQDKVRVVESMAEGVITGFLKAVLLSKFERLVVKEYITAPKSVQEARIRGAEFFNWPVANEGEIRGLITGWLEAAGLVAPKVDITPAEIQEERKQEFAPNQLRRYDLEAQVYPLQYPYSEINLGHPVEFNNGYVVISSASKQLGYFLRQILLANATIGAQVQEVRLNNANIPQNSVSMEDVLAENNINLTLAGAQALEHFISRHNEIITTVNDRKQQELLVRLAIWINMMGDDAIREIVSREEYDAHYAYLMERFIFVMRDIADFSTFIRRFSWLLGKENAQPGDFLATEDGQEKIIGITELLHILNKKIAAQKREIPTAKRGLGHLRATAYGVDIATKEEAKKEKSHSSREFLDLWIRYMREASLKDSLILAAVMASFEFGNAQTLIGHEETQAWFSEWEKILNAKMTEAGLVRKVAIGNEEVVISGSRNFAMMYLLEGINRGLLVSKMKNLLDEVTEEFNKTYPQVRLTMSLIHLPSPREEQEIRQVYESLPFVKLTAPGLVIPPDVKDRDYPVILDIEVDRKSVNKEGLEAYLDIASKLFGISYDLTDRKDKSVASYSYNKNKEASKIEIDSGLAAVVPMPDTEASKAFQVFINDIFRQAKEYFSDSKIDNWQVWERSAEYYKNNIEDYFIIMDLLSGNAYGLTDLTINFNRDLKEHKDYFITLRINISLRKFYKDNPNHPYFARFNRLASGSEDWPAEFILPVQ
ncbi:MAG: hypothetical protein WC315_08900, partial [Candidatus Omnitrophota bacterium]